MITPIILKLIIGMSKINGITFELISLQWLICLKPGFRGKLYHRCPNLLSTTCILIFCITIIGMHICRIMNKHLRYPTCWIFFFKKIKEKARTQGSCLIYFSCLRKYAYQIWSYNIWKCKSCSKDGDIDEITYRENPGSNRYVIAEIQP